MAALSKYISVMTFEEKAGYETGTPGMICWSFVFQFNDVEFFGPKRYSNAIKAIAARINFFHPSLFAGTILLGPKPPSKRS